MARVQPTGEWLLSIRLPPRNHRVYDPAQLH